MVSFSLAMFPSCSHKRCFFYFSLSLSLSSLSLCSLLFLFCPRYNNTFIYECIRVRLALLCLHANLYVSWMIHENTVLEKYKGSRMKKEIEHPNCSIKSKCLITLIECFKIIFFSTRAYFSNG